MPLRWRDRRGELHEAIHRPTFVAELDVRKVAIELELTRQAKPRLEAVLEAHTKWIVDRRTSAVMWAGQDTVEMNRIVAAGEDLGLSTQRGLLRVEPLETLKAYALAVAAERAAAPDVSGGN